MRAGVYRDRGGRTVVAEKWTGGAHPDVRCEESDAFVVGGANWLWIHVGDWIVTPESGERQVWTDGEFRSCFESLLVVPA